MGSSRILIVDDDPRLVRVVSMYLVIEGFEVDTAVDGEAALASMRVRRPDVVILDVMMAGIDGFETCRRIKGDPATRNIPVIMFTALSRDGDVETGRGAGADRFINKPFSLVGLGAVIRSFLGTQPLAATL